MINVVANLLNFSSNIINSTGISIKSGASNLYGVNLINSNAYPVYCKFFDKNVTPVIGTDTPKAIIVVPMSGISQGTVNIQPNLMPYRYFASGFYIAASSGVADINGGQLTASLYAEVAYV